MDRRLLEYRPEIEAFEGPSMALDRRTALSASEEMQTAAELLERVDEGDLEGYLVELIDRTSRPAGRPVVKALAGMLGRAARQLLRPAGASPAASAGPIFGLELEGLSPEDQAFELARHFVRFASEASRRAGRSAGAASPQVVARRAASSAAQTLAPGLLPSLAAGAASTGFWFRRGRQVIVLNP